MSSTTVVVDSEPAVAGECNRIVRRFWTDGASDWTHQGARARWD